MITYQTAAIPRSQRLDQNSDGSLTEISALQGPQAVDEIISRGTVLNTEHTTLVHQRPQVYFLLIVILSYCVALKRNSSKCIFQSANS